MKKSGWEPWVGTLLEADWHLLRLPKTVVDFCMDRHYVGVQKRPAQSAWVTVVAIVVD